MKKLILLLLFIPVLSLGQGLLLPTIEDLKNVSYVEYDDQFGLTGSEPDFYSLEKYVPNVISQGKSNACTSFSVIYYGLSTQYNQVFDITNPVDKNGHSFDPFFGYTLINDENSTNNPECNLSNTLVDVFKILKSKGAKKKWFYPHIECYTSSTILLNPEIDNYTNPYEIYDFDAIPGIGYNMSINSAKEQLLNNKPIIVASWFPSNFKNSVQNDGLYSPNDNELKKIKNAFLLIKSGQSTKEDFLSFSENHFGHAITIIGYDDNVNGGSFRVVNSWGNEWGDEGYFWLKYKDFKMIAYEAYVMDLLTEDLNMDNETQFISNNYVRKYYKNGANIFTIEIGEATYEGQYINGMFNGKGIYSFDSEHGKLNVIGNWKNNIMDGLFTIVSENFIGFSVYENGKLIEDNEYGFANDDDEAQKNKEKLIEYWKKYGGKKKIRKSRTIILKQKKVI